MMCDIPNFNKIKFMNLIISIQSPIVQLNFRKNTDYVNIAPFFAVLI